MRKLLILALLVVTACSGGKQTTNDGRINLNFSEDPQSLDPRKVRTLRDLSLMMQLFDGLTRIDQQGKPELALAENIEISPDGKEYNFHIRSCTWSNGDPITAHDFESSWRQVLSPDFPSDYAQLLFCIENGKEAKTGAKSVAEISVKALDERTLWVRLVNPTPYFLELTAFPTFFAVHPAWEEKNDDLISNGPFFLQDWKPSEIIELKKNPTYWDEQNVHLSTLVFSIISDNLTESLLYEKGDLDWLGQPLSNNIAPDVLVKLKNEGKIASYPVAGTFWIKFNTQKEPFNDVRLRKALSYAIHRKELIEHILHGNQQVALGILPPSMNLKNEALFQDHHEKLALELFNDYLKDHPQPEITLSFFSSERNMKLTQYIADTWHKTFGLKVTLEGMERKVYQQKVKMNQYEVGTGDWIADYKDPISYLELFQTSSTLNETGWVANDYTNLIHQALAESDPHKRKNYLTEAEKILMDQMVVAPIYFYSYDYAKNPHIEDVVLSPLGPIDFKRAKKI